MSQSPDSPVLVADGVSKTFGRRLVVDEVAISLGAGECLALFGPNGAGKTTLLRLVAGLLKPTSGVVTIAGASARRDASARARVGLVSHHTMLYQPLTALENVEFSAQLHGLADSRVVAQAALDSMQVGDRAHAPVRTLSRGLQQRVSVARAMVHTPAVVLLDEPYAGLDESGAHALTTLLSSLLARGAALVLVTHNLQEGLSLATQAAIMRQGKLARTERRAAGGQFDQQRFAAEYREVVRHG